MNLYSVLLVDDEEDVIQVIIQKIDWEGMGFSVAGYAHNGVEALEMAEELHPDVVMTDIKMPYMDGLTLSRKLKEMYRTVEIIIFSGFDEFEYAKEALKIGVEEYILKPVDSGELQRVFGRIRDRLDREMDEKRNVDKLRQYYLESLPLLQENFYISLIEGRLPEDQIVRTMENCRIAPWKDACPVVTILHVSTPDPEVKMDHFLLTVSVKKLAEEQLAVSAWSDSRTLMYLGDIVVISRLTVDSDRPREAIAAYTDFMDVLCKDALHLCGARVTAGIGHVCARLRDLRFSWQGARSAVSYRVIYGNAKAINIAEIDPQENADDRWEEQAIRQIMKQIRMGSREELDREVDVCVRRFSDRGESLQKYQIFMMGLMTEISRFCDNNHLDMKEILGEEISAGGETQLFRENGGMVDVYAFGFQADSPEELKKQILKVCVALQRLVQQEHQNTTKSLVTRAREYVREHFAEQNISMENVCRELGVSTSYFSTIFKKETGTSFISYLTDYRMEQAAQLLLTTDARTYEIAEKVGYADANYFSYAFKKQYQMSPSRYRARNRQTPRAEMFGNTGEKRTERQKISAGETDE